MMYLAYDTETTGLPLDYGCTDVFDTRNWPRVYQVGAILFDDEGFEYGRVNRLVKPDGWKIPKTDDFLASLGKGDFHAELGITTEILEEKGSPLREVMEDFIRLAEQADELVCHNASFDHPVMSCEFHRLTRIPKDWYNKRQHCTKLITEPILQIPGFKGKFKWPTLQEAHVHFFGREFDGAHDAMADVQATMDVFLEVAYLQ